MSQISSLSSSNFICYRYFRTFFQKSVIYLKQVCLDSGSESSGVVQLSISNCIFTLNSRSFWRTVLSVGMNQRQVICVFEFYWIVFIFLLFQYNLSICVLYSGILMMTYSLGSSCCDINLRSIYFSSLSFLRSSISLLISSMSYSCLSVRQDSLFLYKLVSSLAFRLGFLYFTTRSQYYQYIQRYLRRSLQYEEFFVYYFSRASQIALIFRFLVRMPVPIPITS